MYIKKNQHIPIVVQTKTFTKPWQLEAPSQYCMTGGIEKQNNWEHRRCETDIKKIYPGNRKAKLDA